MKGHQLKPSRIIDARFANQYHNVIFFVSQIMFKILKGYVARDITNLEIYYFKIISQIYGCLCKFMLMIIREKHDKYIFVELLIIMSLGE